MADNIKIMGNTVGVPNPRSDWSQTDPTKADYIKNKPTRLSEFENDIPVDSETNFDGYITTPEDEPNVDYDSCTKPGIYKVHENYGDEQQESLLIVNGFWDGSVEQLLFYGHTIVRRHNWEGEWSEWKKISVSQTDLNKKVSKEDGKGLSSNDFTDDEKEKLSKTNIYTKEEKDKLSQTQIFTDDLKTRLENNTFDGYYDVDGYNAGYNERLYKSKNGFVIQSVASYSESSSYYGVDQYWYTEGEVYYRHLGDEGGWEDEWKKISVSQTDLDNAIGDIETSLENIIEKYGLGGDSV